MRLLTRTILAILLPFAATAQEPPADARRQELRDLQARGDADFFAGRYAEALDRYREAEALATSLVEEAALPALLANQGALLAVLGRYEEARDTLGRALAESERFGDRWRVAYVLLNQGMIESGSGRYGDALRLLQRAADEWRTLGDAPSEGRARLTIGGVYSEIGLFAEAEAALERALALFEGESSEPDRARTLRTIGLARLDAGRAGDALDVLDRAIPMLRRAGDAWGAMSAVRFRGMALLALERAGEAEAAFQGALGAAETVGDPFEALLARTGLAEALERQERRDEAEAAYREVLSRADPLGTPEASWRARLGLGRAIESRGDEARAIETYLAAIEEIEAIRSVLGSPALRGRYLGDKLELYRRAARLLARAGREEESFRLTEAAKARTLLELGAVRPPDAPEPLPLPEEEARLVRSTEGRLVSLELRAAGRTEERADLLREIGDARAAHAEALLRAELADPRGARLAGIARAPALEEVRRALPGNAALLEYLVGPEGSTVWVVRESNAWFRELAVTEREIEAWVSRILDPIEDLRAGRVDLANLRFDAAAAAALHDGLVAPVSREIEGCDLLLVVPDGALRRLPFSVLVARFEKRPVDPARLFAQYAGHGFLVERLAIASLPTAGLLLQDRSAPREARRLVFADPSPALPDAAPLRAAREEARAVEEALGEATIELLAGEEATEAQAKGASATLYHFATHATLDDARPSYSSVVLAPGDGEDGRLHAYEIGRLAVPGARVVLSGCATAGTAGRGEGLLGLSRAFLQAGADDVVATAWVVDDASTAALMRRFYAGLARGESVPVALRRAQVETLEEGRRSGGTGVHPFTWAGFVSVGAP